MRIITFQDSYVVNDVLKRDRFVFHDKSKYGRTREVDLLESEEHSPIYGFISLVWNDIGGISIPSIYYNWAYLMGYMGLECRDLIELEIPESYIKAIRTTNTHTDLTYPECFDYKDDCVDAIFYEIRKEWIVAVHRSEDNDTGYEDREINVTIINDEHTPLINTDYKVSGDGHAEEDIFKKLADVLYRPVRLSELRYYVNTDTYRKLCRELISMYYQNVDEIISDRKKFREFNKRFASSIVY